MILSSLSLTGFQDATVTIGKHESPKNMYHTQQKCHNLGPERDLRWPGRTCPHTGRTACKCFRLCQASSHRDWTFRTRVLVLLTDSHSVQRHKLFSLQGHSMFSKLCLSHRNQSCLRLYHRSFLYRGGEVKPSCGSIFVWHQLKRFLHSLRHCNSFHLHSLLNIWKHSVQSVGIDTIYKSGEIQKHQKVQLL